MFESLYSQRFMLQEEIHEINRQVRKFHELVLLTLESDNIHIFTSEKFRGLGLTTQIVDFALQHNLPIVTGSEPRKKMLCNSFNFPGSQVFTSFGINSGNCRGRKINKVIIDCIGLKDPALDELDNLGIEYIGFLTKYN